MDLSVVVLSWNTAELTLRALESARRGAEGLDVETICVDNASTDGTVAAVRRAGTADRVIENAENLGFARGNNTALPHARGRYVCFLNSDAAPSPGALTHVVRHLDAHPDVGLAAPAIVGADGRRQRAARPEPPLGALLWRYTVLRHLPGARRASRAWEEGLDAQAPTDVPLLMGACLVARTTLLDRLGGFDEGYPFYWEDVDLCRRARAAGARVQLVPDGPVVEHVGGAATEAGGAPRRAFLHGLLRHASSRLPPPAYARYATVLVLGTWLRAWVEAPRLGAKALRQRLQGREAASRRSRTAAAGWLRFLERSGPTLWALPRAAAAAGPRVPRP